MCLSPPPERSCSPQLVYSCRSIRNYLKGSNCRYTRGGIVEAAFYIQAINAVLPDLISVFDVARMLRYHFFANMAHTQAYMNSAMEPPLFNLPLRFASAVRTVALGVLYAPVLPISPAISVVGLVVSYFADQYLALHISRKPRAFDVDTLAAVNHIIELLPMAQMLLVFLIYFKDADGIVAPFVVGTVIWSFFFLVPLGRLARCARDRNQEEDGTRDVRWVLPSLLLPLLTASWTYLALFLPPGHHGSDSFAAPEASR